MKKKILKITAYTLAISCLEIFNVYADENTNLASIGENAPIYEFADLSGYADIDAIGYIGDSVGESWLRKMTTQKNFGGINAASVTGAFSDEIFYLDGYSRGVANGNKIPVKLVKDGIAGGVNDSVLVPNTGITLNLAKVPTKNITFAVNASGYHFVNVVVNYTDGSKSDNIKVLLERYRSVWWNRSQNDYLDYISGFWHDNINKKWVDKDADGKLVEMAETNENAGLFSFTLPCDEEKIVESVKISGENISIIFAITQELSSSELILEKLNNLWNENKENITPDKNKIIEELIVYIDALEKRGVDISGIISKEETEYLKRLIVTVAANTYRNSKEEIISEITFNQEINTENIEKYIEVTKNGEIINEFTVNAEGKKITLKFPCTKEGGDVFSVTLNGKITLKEDNNITLYNDYIYSYTLKDYISTERNDDKLILTNNSKTAQKITVYIKKSGIVIPEVIEETIETTKDILCEKDDLVYIWDEDMRPVTSIITNNKNNVPVEKEGTEGRLDLSGNKIIVEGKYKESDALICMVLKKDGAVIYVDEILSGDDGSYYFEIPLSEDNNITSGEIYPIISTPEEIIDVCKEDGINYLTNADKKGIIEAIKNQNINSDDIKQLLNADENYQKIIDNEEFTNRIMNISQKLDADDLTLSLKLIKQQVLLMALEKGNIDMIWIGDEFTSEDIMEYESIDSEGVTIYNIFKTGTDNNGKSAVIERINGKKYDNTESFFKELKNIMFEETLKNPATGGVGYISALLTDENAAAVDINIDNYKNTKKKAEIEADIAKAGISTLAELESYIKNWQPKKNSGVSSGESSGGSSGGGASYPVGITPTETIVSGVKEETNLEHIEKSVFEDMEMSHWAYKYVKRLYEKNIISGRGDNKFSPDDNVTRGEIVKMICLAAGMDLIIEESIFTDITESDWCKEYVMTAYKNDIVKGKGNDIFGKNDYVTRQDVCVMLYRYKKLENSAELLFADSNKVADYAKDAVAKLSQMEIVSGFPNGEFKPDSPCSRAQAAVIIAKFFEI